MRNKDIEIERDWVKIEKEYEPSLDDSEKLDFIKTRLNGITPAKRRIFIMWIELGSYAAVARILHCTYPTVKKIITQVIEDIRHG